MRGCPKRGGEKMRKEKKIELMWNGDTEELCEDLDEQVEEMNLCFSRESVELRLKAKKVGVLRCPHCKFLTFDFEEECPNCHTREYPKPFTFPAFQKTIEITPEDYVKWRGKVNPREVVSSFVFDKIVNFIKFGQPIEITFIKKSSLPKQAVEK